MAHGFQMITPLRQASQHFTHVVVTSGLSFPCDGTAPQVSLLVEAGLLALYAVPHQHTLLTFHTIVP